ncbi:MAG TPA: ABC transporter ATP-binding protein [Symbiobacteriaceae bacterium]|nr:ABC transporter ATP-binding protein [Symbiobacteriaceae bacterium]
MLLKLTGITKRFGSLVANDSIDLEVSKGEIHALLGENGAGKSTLMNLLYGLYTPDEGTMEWKGEQVNIRDPRHAISLGIGMVHQHFMLVPVFTVAENIVLGTEPTAGGAIDMKRAIADVRKLSEQYGLAVDPEAKVESISVGQQQRVEILKALYRGAELLILDEPTAVLTPQEVLELGEIMKSLVAQGKTIIIITHKLKEVRHLADRVSVIRRGRKVATVDDPRAKSERELAALMVGRDVTLKVEKGAANPSEVVLQVEGLSAKNHRGVEALKSVSLSVRKGEIVGIAGVDGNGQTELIECMTGLRRVAGGKVRLHGKELTGLTPGAIRDSGLGHIPEDRHARGMVLDFTVAENSILGEQRQFSRFGFLDFGRMKQRAADAIKHFDVRPPEPEYLGRKLSGGNQQKVIIGREVLRGPDFLIAAQPTRGLDVGAIEFIHKRLVAERDAGKAVLLVSLELDEVMALADRILVMYKGEVVAEMPASEATEEKLGLLMAGGAVNA